MSERPCRRPQCKLGVHGCVLSREWKLMCAQGLPWAKIGMWARCQMQLKSFEAAFDVFLDHNQPIKG